MKTNENYLFIWLVFPTSLSILHLFNYLSNSIILSQVLR